MKCLYCGGDIPEGGSFCCWCGKSQKKKARSPKRRGNGQGTVYKRSGGWMAEVTLCYTSRDGKPVRKHRRKQGFRTKKDALAYLESLRAGPQKAQTVTVAALWELFRDELADLSKSKQTAYTIAWHKIEPELGAFPITALSVPYLQGVVDEAASTFYTRRDIKSLLSHLYKIAIRDDITDRNKAQHIRLPKLEASEREVFSDDEIARLWEDYAAEGLGISAYMLIMLYTGIRPGELLTIRVNVVPLYGR